MASFAEGDYLSIIRPQIDSAVQSALSWSIKDGLQAEVSKYAEKNVYSYQASPYMMAQRRYMLDNKSSYDVTVTEHSIIIDGSGISMQNGVGGEVDIVETGDSWNQPRPRPYMEEALQNYVASGEADRALESALRRAGL